MRNALKNMLDLSYTPSWTEILTDFAGALAVFIIPAVFVLLAVALGWGRI
jgi:hypothetical protein